MAHQLSSSAQKVQNALRAKGLAHAVQESVQPTRSAAEAAALVGCDVAQIAKSLIFRAAESDRGVLVITSGANRVHEPTIAALLGEPIVRANPEWVRERTGFAIGGIPPLGHAGPLHVFIDRDLLNHAEIWAAGGTPNALFKLTPGELVQMTGGQVIAVTGND